MKFTIKMNHKSWAIIQPEAHFNKGRKTVQTFLLKQYHKDAQCILNINRSNLKKNRLNPLKNIPKVIL